MTKTYYKIRMTMMGMIGREIAHADLIKQANSTMFAKVLAGMNQQEQYKLKISIDSSDTQLNTSATYSIDHYFSSTQIEHLRHFFAITKRVSKFSEIIEHALRAEDCDFNKLKLAKALHLFMTGQMEPAATARILENYSQTHKPHLWQWARYTRYLHFKKFLKLFKFICLREIFFETQKSKDIESSDTVSVSLDAKFNVDSEEVIEDSQQIRSFFHSSRKKSKDKVMRTVEDYLVS